MALARRACSACAVAVALLLAGSTAPAWAGGAHISILSSDGSVHRESLPAAATAAVPGAARPAVAHPQQARASATRTVASELKRLAPRRRSRGRETPRAPRRLRRRQARRGEADRAPASRELSAVIAHDLTASPRAAC